MPRRVRAHLKTVENIPENTHRYEKCTEIALLGHKYTSPLTLGGRPSFPVLVATPAAALAASLHAPSGPGTPEKSMHRCTGTLPDVGLRVGYV